MAGMSLLKDTLEIPFSQMGGNVMEIPIQCSRPTLHPLVSARGPSSFEDYKIPLGKKNLEDLINLIPPDLKYQISFSK